MCHALKLINFWRKGTRNAPIELAKAHHNKSVKSLLFWSSNLCHTYPLHLILLLPLLCFLGHSQSISIKTGLALCLLGFCEGFRLLTERQWLSEKQIKLFRKLFKGFIKAVFQPNRK